MVILQPLADRRIASLWSAQLLAAVGAEFYMVAVIWTASSLIGREAGFVSAMQAGALLVGAIFGGIVTDRWPHRTTMIGVNVARAALLLVLSGADAISPIGLPMLIVTAVMIALATAAYEPAMQATVPVLVQDGARRHGINGLFDATRRIARILGPGLVALIGSFVPTGQFFTITAASFLLAALAVHRGLAGVPMPAPPTTRGLEAVRDALVGGARAIRGHVVLYYGLAADIISNITWAAGLLLGMALYLRETSATPLTDYGLMMAAYGVGNLASNVYLSGRRPRRPLLWLVAAKLSFGLGVLLLPFAPDRAWIMAFAALAGGQRPVREPRAPAYHPARFRPAPDRPGLPPADVRSVRRPSDRLSGGLKSLCAAGPRHDHRGARGPHACKRHRRPRPCAGSCRSGRDTPTGRPAPPDDLMAPSGFRDVRFFPHLAPQGLPRSEELQGRQPPDTRRAPLGLRRPPAQP